MILIEDSWLRLQTMIASRGSRVKLASVSASHCARNLKSENRRKNSHSHNWIAFAETIFQRLSRKLHLTSQKRINVGRGSPG